MKIVVQMSVPCMDSLCKGKNQVRLIDNQTAEIVGDATKIIECITFLQSQGDCVFFKSEKVLKDVTANLLGLEVVMDLEEAISYIENTNPYLSEIEGANG